MISDPGMTPMIRAARRIGWLLMAAAVLAAAAARHFGVAAVGPVPLIVPVLLTGMVGAMLVINTMLVRALYRRLEAAKAEAAADAAAERDAPPG